PQPVPLLAGVTVMVAITGFVPVLTAVKGVISPDPLAGSPIAGVSLVQVKPAAVPLKLMVVVVTPLLNICGATAFTVGAEFTVAKTGAFFGRTPLELRETSPLILLPAGDVAAIRT